MEGDQATAGHGDPSGNMFVVVPCEPERAEPFTCSMSVNPSSRQGILGKTAYICVARNPHS